MRLGRVRSLTVWPVKSMGGGTAVDAVWADEQGLAGDRAHAFVDQRPMRAGHVVSARNVPGLLRGSACYPDTPGRDGLPEPVVTDPDGRSWGWSDPALAQAVSDDVEQLFGRPLERRRWRTNVHVELDAPAFAEHGWEGGRLHVGDVVLRLLHPCKRCTIPTWAPGGRERTPELLTWFHREHAGRFGINARVEVPGVLRADAEVRVEPPG
jgi:uncharacterized protein YcbX